MKINSLLMLTLAAALQGCLGGTNKTGTVADNTPSVPLPADIKGTYLTISQGGVKEDELGGKNLNTLQMGDKSLALPELSSNEGVKSYQDFIISDNKYKDSRFGIRQQGEDVLVFSQGRPTPDMPKQGGVVYSGDAVLSLNPRGEWGRYVGNADLAASVDFGKGELTIYITPPQEERKFELEANIRGNTFSEKGNNHMLVNGRFYGHQASELGGVFLNKESKDYGAFGGKKFGGTKK